MPRFARAFRPNDTMHPAAMQPALYHSSMRIACILICVLICVLLSGLTLSAQPRRTRNIILVTSDGLRWQELFGGIDPLLASEKSAGMEKAVDLRKRYERPSGE